MVDHLVSYFLSFENPNTTKNIFLNVSLNMNIITIGSKVKLHNRSKESSNMKFASNLFDISVCFVYVLHTKFSQETEMQASWHLYATRGILYYIVCQKIVFLYCFISLPQL